MTDRTCRFATPASVADWYAIDDAVMGGVSSSRMDYDRQGHAVFSGSVSLANNGGFASIRSAATGCASAGGTAYLLTLRGDGKRYKFSIRTGAEFDGVSYQASFQPTAGEWTVARLPAADFVATWRGRVVDNAAPLDLARVQQFGFLIADKQAGPFRLEVRSIEVAD